MSLPFSSVVAVSGVVQTPAFTTEKQHMLLAITNTLSPTTIPFVEFTSAQAFASYFGKEIAEYTQINRYFNFLSKTGLAPDKVVIANWYKNATQAFYKGNRITTSIASLQAIREGSFKITFGTETFEVVVDLTTITTYSDVASLIETAIQANTEGGDAFTNATCTFNTITQGLIITNGTEAGTRATVSNITAGTTGTDISSLLGFLACTLSQGANAETWTDFCDRIYQANSTGFSITTIQDLTNEDIKNSIEWLQTVQNGQTYNTAVRLVFNWQATIDNLVTLKSSISQDYTGYIITYDPYNEGINVLACAICASTDYEATNGTKNFNFQPAVGYTPITNYGTITDYQSGQTNLGVVEALDVLNVSYIYSLGAGLNEQIYYGKGLMAGAFGTEDVQVNEAWIEKDLQVNIINAFDTLEKIKLQGTDAVELMNSLIAPTFEKAQKNGAVAFNGILSNTSKISILQATNNNNAPDTVANNGFYYQVQPLTQADLDARRVRIVICYLCGGVVNTVRIINNLYQG